MQRIAPTDQMTDIESCLQEMLANGEISKAAYKNAVSNLMKNGLTDPSSGITSGGTTTTELHGLLAALCQVSPAVDAFRAKQHMQCTFCLYKILGVYYISIEILRPCHLFHNINGIHRRFYLFLKPSLCHHIFHNICVLQKNIAQM